MYKLKVLTHNIERKIIDSKDYISLTDMAKYKNSRTDYIIQNWMKTRYTIEFIGLWEKIYNPDFKPIEFDGFKNKAGENSFILTPKQWIKRTNAIGIISRSGRNGGTYAHKDIAFEFASWLSVEFKLFLIKDYERLKELEHNNNWNLRRTLSKINYDIHTDAIKNNLVPKNVTPKQINKIYSDEADVLNVALFGATARQWKKRNPKLEGNIRDYANVIELVCLMNLENLNSVYINDNIPQGERLLKLNQISIEQMTILVESNKLKQLNK